MGRTCVVLPKAHTISACDLPVGRLFCSKLCFFVIIVSVRQIVMPQAENNGYMQKTKLDTSLPYSLSALWKYAWRPKPAVPLTYTKFLHYCNECTTVLIRKRMYCVLCCVTVNRKRVMCGKVGTST